MKIWYRRIHLALALVSAIFLVNLSLTGALLVFAKDIQAWCNPQYWTVANSQVLNRQNTPLPTSEIVKQINQLSPSSILFIERNESPFRTWQVRLNDKNYVSINQYTGEVLLHYQYRDTFYGFVMAWHRWLLYNDGDEHPLDLLPPLASLVLCFELILGFYLWARPKNRLKRVKVKWNAKNKVRFMQLHNVLGVYSLIPLFLIAFSGLAFYFKDFSQTVVEALTGSDIQTPEKVTIAADSRFYFMNKFPENYQLDKAVNSAKAALDDALIYRVYLPQSPEEPVKLRMRRPNESHAYSYSWSNPFTGEAIASFDASQTSLATRVWNFKYSYHIGDFIALPVKFIWVFLGLLPAFFVGSGIYIYVKRSGSKR